jgi:hypothetical protein
LVIGINLACRQQISSYEVSGNERVNINKKDINAKNSLSIFGTAYSAGMKPAGSKW